MPELYGPPSLDPLDAFRCHRSLGLRVIEGRRLRRPITAGDSMREKEMDTYCEILIESEIRGKTNVKRGSMKPLWSEDFEFVYFSLI
jgi:C2 domain